MRVLARALGGGVGRLGNVSIFFLRTIGILMSEKVIKTIILNTARTMVPSSKVGRPHKSHEDLLEQFLRILRTGAPWRDVRNIDFRTAHRHFIRWARLGVFESAYQKLLRFVRRPRRDRSFLVVDTTFVKNVFFFTISEWHNALTALSPVCGSPSGPTTDRKHTQTHTHTHRNASFICAPSTDDWHAGEVEEE